MFEKNSNTGGLRKRSSDTDENKTLDVAKKLGVAQELNLASEDVRRDFANGVRNAANVVKFKNLDTDHPDVIKYTEALIKKSLAEPIQDETPWVQAMEDAKIALSNSKAKVYQSPSLKSYMALRDQTKTFKGTKTDSISSGETPIANPVSFFTGNLTDEHIASSRNAINTSIDFSGANQHNIHSLAVLEEYKEPVDQLSELINNETIVYKEYRGDKIGQLNKFSANRVFQSFLEVYDEKELLQAICDEMNVPVVPVASIVFRESYMRSISDGVANLTSAIGDRKYYYDIQNHPTSYVTFDEMASQVTGAFGDHSTGLGAIQPETAREAWDSYAEQTGQDYSDVLPESNYDLQVKLTKDDAFNIETIILVLAFEAKESCKFIDSYKELGTLTNEQWADVMEEYNGGWVYGKEIVNYFPYIKTVFDN